MTVITRLLLACLVGFMHWFFGNLYEIIVFTPNTLFTPDRVAVLAHIRGLFQVSAPYYYFLPWSPLSILATVWLWFMLRRTDLAEVRRWITFAVFWAISAGVVTGYTIVHFNLTLWVGSAQYTPAELDTLLWLNTAVALCRLGLVGATAYCLYRTARVVIPAHIRSAKPA